MPPRLRMHHQLRHGEATFLPRSKIQITDDLLADGCHFIEFGCHADEFTYLLLLLRGQHRLPLGWCHWLRNGSTSGSCRLSESDPFSSAAGSPLGGRPRCGRTALYPTL